MEAEVRILEKLYGGAENEIRPVYGAKRKIVDMMIARRGISKTRRYLKQQSTTLADRLNVAGGQLVMTSASKNYKFVYYNGHIYMDCFGPKWPGKAFESFHEAMIRNLLDDSDRLTAFIPSLVFSITKKCVYRCEHCYAIQSLGKEEAISYENLLRIAREFQKVGIGVIAWEGGEPLLRFSELLKLISETRDQSESLLATTAHGLTVEKAQRLKQAGLDTAIISLDHYEADKHNRFRGNKQSFDMAVNGVRIFRENGILPSIAICATRELFEDDGLYKYLELAKQIGVAFIQILDATPSGNYMGKDVALTSSQMERIKRFHVEVNTDPRYREYPTIQARAFLEDDDLYGCCAANALVYVDNSGNVQPCDLLQISLGNVLQEDVQVVYDRLKEHFPHPTRGRCPAQTLHKEIAAVYEQHGKLPLPYEKCGRILESIKARGLPDMLLRLRDKRRRSGLRDFVPGRRRRAE